MSELCEHIFLSLQFHPPKKKAGLRGAKSKFTSQRKLLFEVVQTSLLQLGKQTFRALRTGRSVTVPPLIPSGLIAEET